jgi:hypothetical protein
VAVGVTITRGWSASCGALPKKACLWDAVGSKLVGGGYEGNMNSRSYTQLQKRYGGKFIATYHGRVIASAKNSKTLFEKIARYVGDTALFVQYIAPQSAVCIY